MLVLVGGSRKRSGEPPATSYDDPCEPPFERADHRQFLKTALGVAVWITI